MSCDPPISAYTLELRTEAVEGEAVVRCAGRLTTETAMILKAEVKPLFAGRQLVILDLTNLTYMDSSGLGTLVGLYVSARGARCALELVNLTPRIRELLGMTNVLDAFENCGRYGTRLP